MVHWKLANLVVTDFSTSVYSATLFMSIGIQSRTLTLGKRIRIMTKSQSRDMSYTGVLIVSHVAGDAAT